MSSGSGSRKNPGAGAAPKEDGSETLIQKHVIYFLPKEH